ncbi:MAG: SLC13 family permease [Gemmatimonadota bacterium]
MSAALISILVLAAIILIATVLPVHMGALSLAAAFVVGMFVLHGSFKARADQIAAGFPGDLFVVLAGVTFLFAIAKNNGTVDWLVHAAVRSVRGRVAILPWMMFFVTALLTGVGAVAPAAVAMIAPIGLGFGARYGISPMLIGLMIVNGASAGSFSPIGIFGSITNGVVERNHLQTSPLTLFLGSFAFNLILAGITVLVFGGKKRVAGQPPPGPADPAGRSATPFPPDIALKPEGVATLDLPRALTIVSLLALAGGALFFGLDVGFSAFVVAVVLSLVDPRGVKGAISQIAWPTVLLVCGIVTYVSLMETIGTIDYLGKSVATVGTALVAALVVCYIGGVVSAFASTTGILGALIPLAVPILRTSGISTAGLITALAISSSVVDASPFSTSGSLVVANAPEDQRDVVFRRLIQWGFSMVALAPLVTWLLLVASGWL